MFHCSGQRKHLNILIAQCLSNCLNTNCLDFKFVFNHSPLIGHIVAKLFTVFRCSGLPLDLMSILMTAYARCYRHIMLLNTRLRF